MRKWKKLQTRTTFLNAIKEDLKIMQLGKIGCVVKNYHTWLNYILKEAYYKEESDETLFNGY